MAKRIKSSGNVFSDMGFTKPAAENLKIRSALMMQVEKYIKNHKLTQTQAAKQLGIDQPRLNKLLKGRIDLFTIDRLVEMLAKVSVNVKLEIAA